MITSDPILACMMALDSGVRTQAAADLEEIGCRVQTGGKGGTGAGHNVEYWSVFACIKNLSQEQQATIYTLYAPSEGESNAWLDIFHDAIVAGVADAAPDWKKLRKKKRELIGWMAVAAIVERRNDLECELEPWGPEKIAYYLAEQHGARLAVNQWQRDWAPYWGIAQVLIGKAEDAALEPIAATIQTEREKYRNEMRQAA